MINEYEKTAFVWCSKRCCWLHVIYKTYENIICTSANQLGIAKYKIHLIVQGNNKSNKLFNSLIFIDTGSNGRIVYDEPTFYNHNHTNLIRKIEENSSINPTLMTVNVK
jgi:hypothetical protein